MTDNTCQDRFARDRFSIVNERTGEIVSRGNENVRTSNGVASKSTGDFIRVFGQFENLCYLPLTATDFKVFLFLFARMDFENYITCNQKFVSEVFNIDKADINRSFKRLIYHRLLYLEISPGGVRRYRVAPQLAFKGSEKVRRREIKRMKDEDLNDAQDSFFLSVEVK